MIEVDAILAAAQMPDLKDRSMKTYFQKTAHALANAPLGCVVCVVTFCLSGAVAASSLSPPSVTIRANRVESCIIEQSQIFWNEVHLKNDSPQPITLQLNRSRALRSDVVSAPSVGVIFRRVDGAVNRYPLPGSYQPHQPSLVTIMPSKTEVLQIELFYTPYRPRYIVAGELDITLFSSDGTEIGTYASKVSWQDVAPCPAPK